MINTCEALADYAVRASWDDLAPEAQRKLKQHLLDSLGCALGAMQAAPIQAIRTEGSPYRDCGSSSTIGGEPTTPERAVFYNGALVRYLDFMDTFLAPGEACHPSDNLAGVLTAAELAGASGQNFLAALAVAYHVQCRLTASGVKIMRAGFDHTLTQAISLGAGISRALGLSRQQAAHAIALCASVGVGLAATRAGRHVSQWKGLASAETNFHCLHACRLAEHGITGPLHVFEGPLGLEQILGKPFGVDWERESYDGILACSLKRFNAEFHAQPCLEGLLELREKYGLRADAVQRITVEIFKVGYEMIGGGNYLDPQSVDSKEDADHSLHYMIAVALLDGQVEPEQYERTRIQSDDVQRLLQKVSVRPKAAYTRAYPQQLPCRIIVQLTDGQQLETEKFDFEGFYTRPMRWPESAGKFQRLGRAAASDEQRQRILDHVVRLETRTVRDLTSLLSAVSTPLAANGRA